MIKPLTCMSSATTASDSQTVVIGTDVCRDVEVTAHNVIFTCNASRSQRSLKRTIISRVMRSRTRSQNEGAKSK